MFRLILVNNQDPGWTSANRFPLVHSGHLLLILHWGITSLRPLRTTSLPSLCPPHLHPRVLFLKSTEIQSSFTLVEQPAKEISPTLHVRSMPVAPLLPIPRICLAAPSPKLGICDTHLERRRRLSAFTVISQLLVPSASLLAFSVAHSAKTA